MLMKFYNNLNNMPMPSNISYFWNFGSLLGIFLILQILSGLFLTFHYLNNIELAFDSISQLMRNVNNGWIIRILHANGASFFFIFIYIHISRGLYFGSYNLNYVWLSGLLIFLLLMMTAFIGYVLPWGQMSFWGATVITNLLTAIPYIGKNITLWIWGGFSVSGATLTRFFSFHFILPFIILMIILIHIYFLHEKGSSNPLGMNSNLDKISFTPFFLWKDIYGFMVIMLFLMIFNFSKPYFFMDADNFIMANPMVTPPHIQPEWYFLFAYAILRSIPNKLGGVMALILSILILSILIFSKKEKFLNLSLTFLLKLIFWIWIMNFLFLTYLGSCSVENPFINLAVISSIFYFLFYFLIFLKNLK